MEPTASFSIAYPRLFEQIGNVISSNVVVYLIGGENLRIKEIKNKTKDCDLVVTNNVSFEIVVNALKDLGYITSGENRKLEGRLRIEPSALLKHPSLVQVDIFTTTISKKLYLSDTMRQRARIEEFGRKHKLTLGILQNEDVFLLKCVTAREHDICEVRSLIRNQNFDWDIVWEEIVKQDKDTGNIVFRTILENIDDLVQQGSAYIPFYKKLLTNAVDEAICMTIRRKRMFKDELISAGDDGRG